MGVARPDGLLEIGHIRKAHGLRGEVSVELGTDRLERVRPGARWFVRNDWLTVRSARPNQARWLVTLDGVVDRTAAERLANVPILAEPIDDPDALWVHELIGADVVEADGTRRGRCVAVVANPADHLLELDGGALVPVVFVTAVEGGVITIDPPAGLFE